MQNTTTAEKEKVQTSEFNRLAGKQTVDKTKQALEKNGFKVILAANGGEAKNKALELIPKGAEVFTMTSITNETIGLDKEINESGNYDAIRPKFMAMAGDPTKKREMKRIGAAPEYALGSVHAITEDGHVFVASNTGSQLGPYIYGADHVIWVVGGQKIVADDTEANKRIWDHSLPLESQRARKAYNLPDTFNSHPRKIVEFNSEGTPDRITIILVDEVLGF